MVCIRSQCSSSPVRVVALLAITCLSLAYALSTANSSAGSLTGDAYSPEAALTPDGGERPVASSPEVPPRPGDTVQFLLGFIDSARANRKRSFVDLDYTDSITAYAPAPSPPAQAPVSRALSVGGRRRRRRLLQSFAGAGGNAKWSAKMTVTDSSGVEQGPFNVIMDTGSTDFLLPGSAPKPFFVSKGKIEGEPVSKSYGFPTRTFEGNFHPVTFHFDSGTEAAGVAVPSHVLVVDPVAPLTEQRRPILGLAYKYSAAVDRDIDTGTPLQDFYDAAKLEYSAFTVFLHSPLPRPDPGGFLPKQGQLGFGATLPDLVDLATGINAPPFFNDVDLACHANVKAAGSNTNWAVPIEAVTSDPGSAPLSTTTVSFCALPDVCEAIIDTGYPGLGFRANDLPVLYTALGLPEEPVVFDTIFGRPAIDCRVRTRSGPTLDYQIGDRIYSLAPADYILVNSLGVCTLDFRSTGSGTKLALGAPFIAKFPGSFFTDTSLPTSAPSEGPKHPRTCFYGTVPVKATCAPEVVELAAEVNCSKRISEDDLLVKINRANKEVVFTSSPATPDQTTFTLFPPPVDGHYTLPVGDTGFTLTATTPLGSSSCGALVRVSDQEPLSDASISCTTPADGVLLAPQANGTTPPAAVYAPTASKANGCPVSVSLSDLACRNCMLGAGGAADVTKCASRIFSDSVGIGAEQKARVHWTVSARDGLGRSATKRCDVCVTESLVDECPTPFTAASACELGQY